jgi:hypothetical protein
VLLLALVGAWTAERARRWHLAGALVGTAAAVKLFPGFLLLYFVARRRWRAVFAGVGWFTAANGVAAVVLGPGTYRDYVGDVLPRLAEWRASIRNLSVPGLWNKLFDPGSKGEVIQPLLHSPALAMAATVVSVVAIMVVVAWVTCRARSRAARDQAFGVTVIGMLLVAPLTWPHSAVMLLLPLLLIRNHFRASHAGRMTLALVVVVFWLDPVFFWHLCGVRLTDPANWQWGPTGPLQSVTAFSVQLYALLGLFALGLVAARSRGHAAGASRGAMVVTMHRFAVVNRINSQASSPSTA